MASLLATIVVFALASLTSSKPIMVKFGTNDGPITPQEITASPRSYRHTGPPAPVSEVFEDIPDPFPYKPMKPHQYRFKVRGQRPVSLIFGTPLDVLFTPSVAKAERKMDGAAFGFDYTGPHLFTQQPYELEQRKVEYVKGKAYKGTSKRVPQIGIVYSSGLKYYVPQLTYEDKRDEDFENSVYDHPGEKLQFKEKNRG